MRRARPLSPAAGLVLAVALALGMAILNPQARAQLSGDGQVSAEALIEAQALKRAGKPWEALALLDQLRAQGLQGGPAIVVRAEVLESVGAFGRAHRLMEAHLGTLPAGASFELRGWSRRLAWLAEGQVDARAQVDAELRVAMGVIDLDPRQAWAMVKEVQGSLPLLDDAAIGALIRQTEILGHEELAVTLAERVVLLAVSDAERRAAELQLAEVRARIARGEEVLARVVMPGGEFKLGTTGREWRANGRRDIDQDERPAHKVVLSPYAIGSHEVTVQAYRRCQIEGVCPPPRVPVNTIGPLQPMVGITWDAAAAYCGWVGGRLPTEAEWEAAARGSERRPWPWGEAVPTCDRVQMRGCELVSGGLSFAQAPAPVGSRPDGATDSGLYDMAGNVAEWVLDGYRADGYEDVEKQDPTGPEGAELRVTRGGSFDRKGHEVRGARREARVPTRGYAEVGVRCAWDLAP